MRTKFKMYDVIINVHIERELISELVMTKVCDGFKIYKKLLPKPLSSMLFHWNESCPRAPLRTEARKETSYYK